MDTRQQLSLPSDDQLCTSRNRCIGNLFGCATHADRRHGICAAQAEPCEFLAMFAFEIGVDVRTRPHKAGSDGDDLYASVSQFGAQTL